MTYKQITHGLSGKLTTKITICIKLIIIKILNCFKFSKYFNRFDVNSKFIPKNGLLLVGRVREGSVVVVVSLTFSDS